MSVRRKLVWINEKTSSGWGCSECAWVCDLSGPPTGDTLDEMMQNYVRQRDQDFAAHVCAAHPRAKKKRE
jgi:hypothetical protein